MNNKKKCFVIMPISKTKSCTEDEWTGIFEHMIKPAITGSGLGFECERAKPRTGAFIKDILEGLNRADVVIADLTDRNPNVCYELGIRHTLKNRTIIIAQNIKHVPSDLKSYWVVEYKKNLTGANEFKRKVREILREMQKNPDKPDSPIADFLSQKNIDIFAYEKSENLKKLGALISEMSFNIDAADIILTTMKKNAQVRKEGKVKEVLFPNRRLQNICFELLLSTSYIMLTSNLLNLVRKANESIMLTNKALEMHPNQKFTEEIERKLKEALPPIKNVLTALLKEIVKFKNTYTNDNYQEPKEPIILLASPEHEDYLKIIK